MTLFIIILGAVMGSFANVCIYRIPRKESIAYPPSHCPRCSARLRGIDLVPILSFLVLRGRCRYCKEAISARYLIVEIIMAIGFGVLWSISMGIGEGLWLIINFFIFVVLTVIDLEYMLLPNKLTLTGIVIGLVFAGFGLGPGLKGALLGGIAGFFVLALIRVISRGKMGGGDVKLLAYIGTLVGPWQVFFVLFFSALFGVLFNIPLIAFQRRSLRGEAIPFGPYMIIGAMLFMIYGDAINDFLSKYFLF